MELKVAANSLHWSPSFSSAKSFQPSKRRRRLVSGDGSTFTPQLILSVRPRSCNSRKSSVLTVQSSLTSVSNSFPDEEFWKNIQEFATRFHRTDDVAAAGSSSTPEDSNSNFPERDETIPGNIERKANSLDIPFSLRIIKSKKKWQEGFTDAGETACCSIKKAFSSMVFIIRELHSYTLQMREALFYEDLQGIIARVQKDMHASFVWLFEKVFSHTPTLMVYVMILLANYSVHSLSISPAIAVTAPTGQVEDHRTFDFSVVRTANSASMTGKAASVGGRSSGGGGGNYKPIASGMDGDGRFDDDLKCLPSVVPDGVSSSSSRIGEESVSNQESRKEGPLDQIFQSRDDAGVVDGGEYSDHLRTEMQYETQLACDPKNSLLLANYAQYLYEVAKDYDRCDNLRGRDDVCRESVTCGVLSIFL
ncbi:uncharacterized protein LOC127259774 isoform X3 [Andrographis paniculata]|uniref:uncharacterized protein LOC127259774 isoform X2 n=1 Tax=Andrographis paniculata TaxID=175694 RepID=UPI0021E91634|nr:uncharacterized protein LOC127259774 isoform X2 [Andrographis paniculata]XP_051143318.1 uncharacterized protein LOC127259774 isoform X3 [Andrographis paniculata]